MNNELEMMWEEAVLVQFAVTLIFFVFCWYQIGRSLVRSQLVPSEFFIDIKSFRSHYGTGVDSASNRNEYQERFLG